MDFLDRISPTHKVVMAFVAMFIAGVTVAGSFIEFRYKIDTRVGHVEEKLTTRIEGIEFEVAVNTTSRLISIYDRLIRKYRAEGHLSIEETVKFCNAAKQLRIGGPEVSALCQRS